MKKNVLRAGKGLLKIIFYGSLIFLGIAVFSITIAQGISIEFKDWRVMHDYYDIIFELLPFAVLLTLSGTIKKRYTKLKNLSITGITIMTFFFSCFMIMGLMFRIGFGAWIDQETLYQNRANQSISVKRQIFDAGALGYGGTRIVKLKPFLYYWNIITEVDVEDLDQKEWVLVAKYKK
jgi:hypothetical protein